ncbi:MAG TPA: transglutaminase family protein [Steroidobacteraceae bacterium]|nr:transglutaminase family protein [Steroidobacteraceae bacterium]
MNGVVRYRMRHQTVYHYGGDVAHSHQLLHLAPRNSPSQVCLSRRISLDPQPSTLREDVDAFGNFVTRLEYDLPHDRLEVLAESSVAVSAPTDAAQSESAAWEEVRDSLCYSGRSMSAEFFEACRFRMESTYVRVKQTFSDYAEDCLVPGRPLLPAAQALMHKLHRDFTYAPGTTNIRTSVIEAFTARRGVCQDFAHIMLACLRSRGLAARYVSGYLRTTPPPGPEAGLLGADASHAWVSVFCPPLGWVDLDPTNDMRVGNEHIVVAWGRDFGDVSPLRGVIVGGGRHRLTVRVSVQAE